MARAGVLLVLGVVLVLVIDPFRSFHLHIDYEDKDDDQDESGKAKKSLAQARVAPDNPRDTRHTYEQ